MAREEVWRGGWRAIGMGTRLRAVDSKDIGAIVSEEEAGKGASNGLTSRGGCWYWGFYQVRGRQIQVHECP